jgi:hypothetical protein
MVESRSRSSKVSDDQPQTGVRQSRKAQSFWRRLIAKLQDKTGFPTRVPEQAEVLYIWEGKTQVSCSPLDRQCR